MMTAPKPIRILLGSVVVSSRHGKVLLAFLLLCGTIETSEASDMGAGQRVPANQSEAVLQAHVLPRGEADSVDLSPDGRLAVVLAEKNVQIWDFRQKKMLSTVDVPTTTVLPRDRWERRLRHGRVRYSRDGGWVLVYLGYSELHVLTSPELAPASKIVLDLTDEKVYAVELVEALTQVAVLACNDKHCAVTSYNLSTGRLIHSWNFPGTDYLQAPSMAFRPDGEQFAVALPASKNHTAYVLETLSGKVLTTFKLDCAELVKFTQQNQLLTGKNAFGCGHPAIEVYDATSGRRLRKIDVQHVALNGADISVSSDGRTLLAHVDRWKSTFGLADVVPGLLGVDTAVLNQGEFGFVILDAGTGAVRVKSPNLNGSFDHFRLGASGNVVAAWSGPTVTIFEF